MPKIKFYSIICLWLSFFTGIFILIEILIAPTVSVVMPVYNREDLVSRATESILNQSFTDFEFIIVDDGSTDETKKIIEQYAKNDGRIKIISYPDNKGRPVARQIGMDAAKGKYIAIMDSDDWAVPDMLLKEVHFMEDYPEIDVVRGRLGDVNHIHPTAYQRGDDTYRINKMPGFYEVDLMFDQSYHNLGNLFRRDFVRRNNITYDLDHPVDEDYHFWMDIILKGGKLASLYDRLAYSKRDGTDHYWNEKHPGKKGFFDTRNEFLSLYFDHPQEIRLGGEKLYNKCHVLAKMISMKKQTVNSHYLPAYYKIYCPEDLEKSFYLKYPHNTKWLTKTEQGFMLDGKLVQEKGKNDILHVIQNTTEQFFLKKNNNIYYKIPDQNEDVILIVQPNHFYYMQEKDDQYCTFGKHSACADFTEKKSTLTLKWENQKIEIFKKNHNYNYYQLQ